MGVFMDTGSVGNEVIADPVTVMEGARPTLLSSKFRERGRGLFTREIHSEWSEWLSFQTVGNFVSLDVGLVNLAVLRQFYAATLSAYGAETGIKPITYGPPIFILTYTNLVHLHRSNAPRFENINFIESRPEPEMNRFSEVLADYLSPFLHENASISNAFKIAQTYCTGLQSFAYIAPIIIKMLTGKIDIDSFCFEFGKSLPSEAVSLIDSYKAYLTAL